MQLLHATFLLPPLQPPPPQAPVGSHLLASPSGTNIQFSTLLCYKTAQKRHWYAGGVPVALKKKKPPLSQWLIEGLGQQMAQELELCCFERIWTGGKGGRGYWGEEGQRVTDPTLIHRFHALGLVASPLLSSCLCCRFSEGTQHYGGGRKLSYSVVLLSSLRDKIKTQRGKKRTYGLLLKIPSFTFSENHFFDQSILWPEFQSRFIIPRKLCCY